MTYQLGIDLGTTFTAAAVHRDGKIEVVVLGSRAAAVPSILFVKDDETVLTGEAAGRRGLTEPGRMAREFKRRVGDPAPIILGGAPYSADALTAKLLRWVVDQVSVLEGGAPEHVTVCHPANWGPYKRDLLDQAIRQADVAATTTTITEPEAAAVYYASTERVEPGSVVAVYDLGGGTFDAAVLRKLDQGWEMLGEPEGIERLGGIDFDEAVFQHVRGSLGEKFEALNPSDATAVATRLREDSVAAKEALSSDTDTAIPVMLPDGSTEIRLTRAEFEAMVRPMVLETVEAMKRALRSARLAPDQVDKVLLVGGSSRIPSAAQIVGAELGRPVAVDAHPKHAIALGAALTAAHAAGVAEGAVTVDPGSGAAKIPFRPTARAGGDPSSRRRSLVIAGAAAAALAVGGVAFATLGGGGGGGGGESESATATTANSQGIPRDSACDLVTEAEAEDVLTRVDLSPSTVDVEACVYDTVGGGPVSLKIFVEEGEGSTDLDEFRAIAATYARGRHMEDVKGAGDAAIYDRPTAVLEEGEVFLHFLARRTMVTLSLTGWDVYSRQIKIEGLAETADDKLD